MLLEEIDIRLYRTLLVRANIGFVVLEINVLYALREQFLLGWSSCGGRRWRGGLSDGHPRRCLLCPPGSLRSQRVGSRIGRSYLLRAAGLHGSNPVDAHVGGICGLPRQRCRLSLFNGVGIRRERGCRCWRWWRRWGRGRWGLLMASAEE